MPTEAADGQSSVTSDSSDSIVFEHSQASQESEDEEVTGGIASNLNHNHCQQQQGSSTTDTRSQTPSPTVEVNVKIPNLSVLWKCFNRFILINMHDCMIFSFDVTDVLYGDVCSNGVVYLDFVRLDSTAKQ